MVTTRLDRWLTHPLRSMSVVALVALAVTNGGCDSAHKPSRRSSHGARTSSALATAVPGAVPHAVLPLLPHLPNNPRTISLVDVVAARSRLGLPAHSPIPVFPKSVAADVHWSAAQFFLNSAAGQVVPLTSPVNPVRKALDSRLITAGVTAWGPRAEVDLIATTEAPSRIGPALEHYGFRRRQGAWTQPGKYPYYAALFKGGIAVSTDHGEATQAASAHGSRSGQALLDWVDLVGPDLPPVLTFSLQGVSRCTVGYLVSDELNPHRGELMVLFHGPIDPRRIGGQFFDARDGVILDRAHLRSERLTHGITAVRIPLAAAKHTAAVGNAFPTEPMPMPPLTNFYPCP